MKIINNPEIIEVLISKDGQTLWVHAGYECVLRASKIKKLLLKDNRNLSEFVGPIGKVG